MMVRSRDWCFQYDFVRDATRTFWSPVDKSPALFFRVLDVPQCNPIAEGIEPTREPAYTGTSSVPLRGFMGQTTLGPDEIMGMFVRALQQDPVYKLGYATYETPHATAASNKWIDDLQRLIVDVPNQQPNPLFKRAQEALQGNDFRWMYPSKQDIAAFISQKDLDKSISVVWPNRAAIEISAEQLEQFQRKVQGQGFKQLSDPTKKGFVTNPDFDRYDKTQRPRVWFSWDKSSKCIGAGCRMAYGVFCSCAAGDGKGDGRSPSGRLAIGTNGPAGRVPKWVQ
ncbi:MAG: hypothetical protein M1833_000284 [Piccolia ochrophora]|nr:MAG: hypothetical protein M1833_000284 [Piccolia ochrophora]